MLLVNENDNDNGMEEDKEDDKGCNATEGADGTDGGGLEWTVLCREGMGFFLQQKKKKQKERRN